MDDLRPHPLAELFPMLSDKETAELADDICTYGQRDPIVLHEGMILDGRNRLAACRFAEIEPHFVDYDGDDPLGFVLSKNLHRRHLTESQRAMVAARIVDWDRGLNQHTAGPANLQTREAARRLSISERAVAAARRIHEHGAAELVEAIREGRVSVHAGEALSELEHEAQIEVLRREERDIVARAKAIREARQRARHTVRLAHMEMVAERGQSAAPSKVERLYPVVYADPPWRFSVRDEATGREKSAENHYPTMATEQIAGLLAELGGVAARDAVIFLWATNPMLLDGLRTLQAWGFTYVHHWIWDKEVAGTGYWGRDRHELLLIGRRGDAVAPLPGTQPETVHRERKGPHSAKPDWFAEQIERLYPGIGKIELFARAPRAGWDVWGFEAEPAPDVPAMTGSKLPPAPGLTAPVEFSVGGMRKSSASFSVFLNADGTYALSARYDISGHGGGASPRAGRIRGFAGALRLGLEQVEERLAAVRDDRSSVCTDRHRAAARGGLKWIEARRAEWGLSTSATSSQELVS